VVETTILTIWKITGAEWLMVREKRNGAIKGAEIVMEALRGRPLKFQEAIYSVSMVITALQWWAQSQGGGQARLQATAKLKRSNHFFFLLKNWARSHPDIDDEHGSEQSRTTDLKGKTGDDEDVMNNIKITQEALDNSPEGLSASRKMLGNMGGDEADPSKTAKTESAYMDTQSFFFTLKGGKGNMEDIAKEREFRLNRIRKLHKPMDYKKLKQHELSFMSEILTKRAKKKEEMAIKLKEQQQAYKVSYKSKLHNTFEKDYKGVRHGVQV
jgi:hypothetical protein